MGEKCGTLAGYAKHGYYKESVCTACRLAKRNYDRRRRASPEKAEQARMRATAQSLTYRALARRYKAEYDALYADFKAYLGVG